MRIPALLATLCAVALALVSCSTDGAFTPKPDEMLSPAEMAAVTGLARNFLTESKKLKISDEEREIIRKTEPENVRARYTAPKRGRLSFTWRLKDGRFIIAMLEGDMISEGRQPWGVQIFTAQQPVYSGQSAPKAPPPVDGKDAGKP